MIHAYRPFVTTALFSGTMSLGAFAGAVTRDDDAFSQIGCALACQAAVLIASGFCVKPGTAFWTPARIVAVCLPSFAAAALGVALALERGLWARHSLDLLLFAAVLACQGRAFAAHISDSDRPAQPAMAHSMRSRLVVRLRDEAPRLGE